jgi:hypothetical protein
MNTYAWKTNHWDDDVDGDDGDDDAAYRHIDVLWM